MYYRSVQGPRARASWYIEQPCSKLIDLDRSNEEILAESEAFCRAQPGFRPVEEWWAAMAERIAAHDRA